MIKPISAWLWKPSRSLLEQPQLDARPLIGPGEEQPDMPEAPAPVVRPKVGRQVRLRLSNPHSHDTVPVSLVPTLESRRRVVGAIAKRLVQSN